MLNLLEKAARSRVANACGKLVAVPARALASGFVVLICTLMPLTLVYNLAQAAAPSTNLATSTTQELGAAIGQNNPSNNPPRNLGHPASVPMIIPPPPTLNVKSYVIMDAHSGKIIAEDNMDKRLPPASLTKMMTLYVASSALSNGQISLQDKVRVSKKAWSMGGSRMFLKAGSYVTVQQLIQGIIVDSGNDACVTLAQYIGGNETTFAHLMNETAKALGMKDSHFTDSTGLPHPDHYSTAHNLAILARALIANFPEDYKWYKQKWFTYGGIRQSNRNLLLWRDPSVDGLKTGHTQAAGYCLVASAQRNGMRLISVVMGTPSMNARAEYSQALLNYGFRYYRTKQMYHANQPVAQARVWFGQKRHVKVGPMHAIYATLPINKQDISLQVNFKPRLQAPINQGQILGTATLLQDSKPLQSFDLLSLESDQTAGLWGKLTDHFLQWWQHMWQAKTS